MSCESNKRGEVRKHRLVEQEKGRTLVSPCHLKVKKGTSFLLGSSVFCKKTQQRLIIRIEPKSANNERSSILFPKFRENKQQHTLPTLLNPRKQDQPGNGRTAIAQKFSSGNRSEQRRATPTCRVQFFAAAAAARRSCRWYNKGEATRKENGREDDLRAGCAPLMGSRAGAGNKAEAGIASTAKLIFLRLSGEGRRREEKGREGDEKDNQSSQYGDKIRSQD